MGDRIGVQLLVRDIYLSLTNHPGLLSLAIPPWVGAMSTDRYGVALQVTLCDLYLNALEAFARRRAIQIHVYFILFQS